MSWRRSLAVLLAIGTGLAVGGCGSKRKPEIASATARGGRGQPTPVQRPAEPQPVDSGPDVQPLTAEGTSESDFPVSDPGTGEGGPLSDVLFGYNDANLSEEARATLEKHALWLQNHRDAKVIVEGHCDERGTVEYNLALGDKRARAAHEYLVNLGVGADRLKAVSYGKERPVATGHDEASWARNRRAHFQVGR